MREKVTRGRERETPRRVSPFLTWGDFHARLRFAHSTILEEQWGTTRSLHLGPSRSTTLKIAYGNLNLQNV